MQYCQQVPTIGEMYVIAAYESGTIALYDLRNTNISVTAVYTLETLDCITAGCISSDQLLLGDAVGRLWMLQVSSYHGITYIQQYITSNINSKKCGIGCLDIRYDGIVVAVGSWDECLRLYDLRTLDCMHEFEHHSDQLTAISFQQESTRFATTGKDGNMFLWDSDHIYQRQQHPEQHFKLIKNAIYV